jgi:hypothetical protein
MALFFNLEVLEREAAGDPDKFLALLTYHHRGSIPLSSKSKYKPSKTSLKGSSYLLNPDPVLNLENIDTGYRTQYIRLAGRRDWFLYKTYGVITLDRSFFPDLLIDKIKSNPLLIIETNLIKFKYEEIYNGSKIWRNKRQGS